ncbi:MAG: DUF1924 domain-containing protein [Steroidobacteraceae bacterium]
MKHKPLSRLVTGIFAAATLLSAVAAAVAATPDQLLASYTGQASMTPSALRGQQFFNVTHGKDWSCASCHGAKPVQRGKHMATGKPIAPLAPAANPDRFVEAAKTEKWFRRNCNDVVGRECTLAEKADVLSWLLTLEP